MPCILAELCKQEIIRKSGLRRSRAKGYVGNPGWGLVTLEQVAITHGKNRIAIVKQQLAEKEPPP